MCSKKKIALTNSLFLFVLRFYMWSKYSKWELNRHVSQIWNRRESSIAEHFIFIKSYITRYTSMSNRSSLFESIKIDWIRIISIIHDIDFRPSRSFSSPFIDRFRATRVLFEISRPIMGEYSRAFYAMKMAADELRINGRLKLTLARISIGGRNFFNTHHPDELRSSPTSGAETPSPRSFPRSLSRALTWYSLPRRNFTETKSSCRDRRRGRPRYLHERQSRVRRWI